MTYVSCFYHAFSGAQKVSSSRSRLTLTLHCSNKNPPGFPSGEMRSFRSLFQTVKRRICFLGNISQHQKNGSNHRNIQGYFPNIQFFISPHQVELQRKSFLQSSSRSWILSNIVLETQGKVRNYLQSRSMMGTLRKTKQQQTLSDPSVSVLWTLTVFPQKGFTSWSGLKFPNSCQYFDHQCLIILLMWFWETSPVCLLLWETLVDVSSVSLQLLTLLNSKCLFYYVI